MFVQSACLGLQLPPSAWLLQQFELQKLTHNLPESPGFTLPGVTSLPALSPVTLCGLLPSVVCRVEVESLTQAVLGLTAALPWLPEGWNYINDTRALKGLFFCF